VKDNIYVLSDLKINNKKKKKHFLTQKIKEKLHSPLNVECKKTE